LFEETLRMRMSKLGSHHPYTLTSRNNLALAYRKGGRLTDAIPLLEETLRLQTSKLGPDHPDTLTSRNNLAAVYFDARRTAEAIAMQEETLKLSTTKLGAQHPDTLVSTGNLARSYRAAGRLGEAIPLFEKALKGFKLKLGPEHPHTLASMNYLAESYLDAKRWPEAETVLRESLMVRDKSRPDDWLAFSTRSQFGGSLLGQKKYAEAEPLILQGYEGMKAREAKIPAPSKKYLAEAAERVVKLYEAWGKPDKAAQWRDKLARDSVQSKPRP
jgi:tetratricopeptide (TPR) repeat protein